MPPTQKPRRLAILDLGSNSIKLLVAEVNHGSRPRILLEKSVGTRLGEGIHHHFQLNEAAIQRTLEVVYDFKLRCKKLGITEWRAVATSAVRDATNRREFEKRFRACMGFSLRVLSGKEEAEWIYRAAVSDAPPWKSHDQFLVMDSGGGSAEWIRGTRIRVEKCISMDLGCVRMTERFLCGDPYTKKSYRTLLDYYERRLWPLREDFSGGSRLMIGTGGSICTAAALDQKTSSFQSHLIHGHTISLRRLKALLKKLRKMTNAERLEWEGLPKKRADIIVAGLALFVVTMQILGVKKVTTSLRGLRYGVLMQEKFKKF